MMCFLVGRGFDFEIQSALLFDTVKIRRDTASPMKHVLDHLQNLSREQTGHGFASGPGPVVFFGFGAVFSETH